MACYFAKRLHLLTLLVASLLTTISEQCVRTPVSSPVLLTPTTTTAVTTTTTTSLSVCTCTSPNCGFIIDSDAVTQQGISQQQISSVSSCTCAKSKTLGCYPAQPNAMVTSGDSFIIDLACANPADFCVCDVNGQCFKPILGTSLSDIQFFPYQDTGGCFAYAVPFCFGPGDNQSDGLQGNMGTTFTCLDAPTNGFTVGSNTSFIKVLAASCRGCSNIQGVTSSTCH